MFGKKIASPPTISDIAGDWIGTEGAETFYLRLKEDASGKSVYIVVNAKDGSISLITKWALNNRQITRAPHPGSCSVIGRGFGKSLNTGGASAACLRFR